MAGKPSIIADGVSLAPLEKCVALGAEPELRALLRSIDRDPCRAHRALGVAASWFAEFPLDMRRYDEALVYVKKALEPAMVAGNIHAFSGNPDLAIPEYQRALEIEPNYGLANHFLGRAYLAKGQTVKAIEQIRRSNELLGAVPFSMGDLGYALASGGHRAEAQKMLTDMNRKRQDGYFPAFAIAEVELGLGRTEAALDWLEHAAEERHMGYYLPSADPIYQPLRTNPRFLALTQQMHTGISSY